VAKGVSEQIPSKAEKTPFEKLLEEGKREQADEQPPAVARVTESQGAPAQTPAFHALGMFGGNPLPLEGQTLPPAADTPTPEALVAGPATQPTQIAPGDALTAAGLSVAAPRSLFVSPLSLPTLLDLDGPDPSLFGNSSLVGASVPISPAQPAVSIFTEAPAGTMLAANDATSLDALFTVQPQSAADGVALAGGLHQIVGGAPKEPTGTLAVGSAEGLVGGVASPASQSGAQPVLQSVLQPVLQERANALIQAAQPVITGPGVDAPSTAAQTAAAMQSAAVAAAQSATSPDTLSAALAVVAGAEATVASAVLPEANVSVAAETAQPAAETANAQGQAAEIAWQPDAAERARAWRGISTLDPASGLLQGTGQGAGQGLAQGLAQAGRHEFSVNYTLAAGQGGQLQQFAEALRQAGGTAEAGPQSNLQAAAQSGTHSAAAQTAERGASVFTASTPGPESQQAWRADSAAAGVTAPGSRGAAGTLSFAQGMQASTFGQPLGQSFGDSEWAESVTKRVALMAGQKVSSAQIELDPPELGALTVRVSVSGDQANVMFTSAHAQVREALEQTFTRLQDMLGQQGLQLADAQVSDQSAARQQQGEGRSGQGEGGVFADEGDAGPVTMQSLKLPKGLVDYYA
jgi:flagellar hook-length control protein FliK